MTAQGACAECGVFVVGPENTTVYQWKGAHPARMWRSVPRCPTCGEVVGAITGATVAAVLKAQGAATVTFRRPAEIDDPKWQDRCPLQDPLRAAQAARCAFSFHTEDSLAYEVDELAQEMGL